MAIRVHRRIGSEVGILLQSTIESDDSKTSKTELSSCPKFGERVPFLSFGALGESGGGGEEGRNELYCTPRPSSVGVFRYSRNEGTNVAYFISRKFSPGGCIIHDGRKTRTTTRSVRQYEIVAGVYLGGPCGTLPPSTTDVY